MLSKLESLAIAVIVARSSNPSSRSQSQEKPGRFFPLLRKSWLAHCEDCCPPKREKLYEIEKCSPSYQDVGGGKDSVSSAYNSAQDTFLQVYGSVMSHVKYLQDEATDEVKAGAIAGAFVVGYLLSFRRRFMRKVFNGTLLAAVTASIAYPREARCVARNGFSIVKSAVSDAYNAIASKSESKECRPKSSKKKKKTEGE